jgi:hypothetical protein
MTGLYSENPEVYEMLLDALRGFAIGIAPTGSMQQFDEAEDFWRKLLSQYKGDDNRDARIAWLRTQIPKYFRSLDKPPQWIQDKEWQFAGGMPMIFAGQLDIKRTNDNLAGKFFHDDVSYYLFLPSYDLIDDDKYYEDRTIMQRW